MRWLVYFIFAALTANSQNYYFGNLHAHTGFSDGNKDSTSSGVSKPDGSYSYAKLSDDFDFLGISEHNHFSSNKNPGFKLPRYAQGLNMADAANNDGTFLAMFGMEFGVSSSNNGHVIIYGFNQLMGWETNIPGEAGNNYDIYNAKNDYTGLFQKVKNNSNAFCYLAHPFWTDFSTNGNDSTALAFMPYNAMFDSAIVGMPLRSGNAFSTFTNYNDYATGDYFNYYKKLLYIGYHLGMGYDHDNHNTNFGRGNGGRLVVLAPALTRSDFYKAMKQMNFYGSDDANARVDFRGNGHVMGSVVKENGFPDFTVVHSDPDGENADTIRLWRGNRNSGGLWAQVMKTVYKTNTLSFTDYNIQPGIEYYYFADIKQGDNQWIVTSPIWYTPVGPLSVAERERLDLLMYPNPVTRQLSLSVPFGGNYSVEIRDVAGRTVMRMEMEPGNNRIDLTELEKGVYSIIVADKTYNITKKLVIESGY